MPWQGIWVSHACFHILCCASFTDPCFCFLALPRAEILHTVRPSQIFKNTIATSAVKYFTLCVCVCLSVHWDHTLCRALVLPKQSPWLFGTILDGSPLRRRIPASWHSFCRPQKDDGQSQPHLVFIEHLSGIWTQDPQIPCRPPQSLSQHQA